jgi:16S rRNA (cytidine1402-2'-O)-methyltransferase
LRRTRAKAARAEVRHRTGCAASPRTFVVRVTTPPAALLRRAAAEAAGDQQYPSGALYVVATPIGNLADLTLRAIHALGLVDAIACEDTRHSAALLEGLGIDVPRLALHAHNERAASGDVLARLARGERIACITDAGTPGISDPGATLVAAVHAAGLRVIPIPGASSATAALSVAGADASSSFRFAGFLAARGAERERALARVLEDGDTVVLFEAPHRIGALAAALAERAPERTLTVARELTKQFENVATMKATALPAWLAADAHRRRGEFVLVLHAEAPAARAGDAGRHDALLQTLLRALPLSQAAALAAELSGAPRNALYARALALRALAAGPPSAPDAPPSGGVAADDAP